MTENESLKYILAYKFGRGCKPQYSYEEIQEAFDAAISALKEIQQYREIGTVEECREAVEKQKVFCESAEKYADGKCVGYGKSEMDDEPIGVCKRCKSYVGLEESEEE